MLEWLKRWSAKTSARTETLSTGLADVSWLAVDLELTGLEIEKDDIVSVGWLQGQRFVLQLDTCHHAYVKTEAKLNQSPIIHGITDRDLQQGDALQRQLALLRGFAQSHVWVFHHHVLDWGVLKRRYRQLDMIINPPLMLDTLLLERYLTSKGGAYLQRVDLASSRQRHKLPVAPAHNALDDACATLELLYAQLAELGVSGHDALKSLRHTGALIS